MNRFLLLAAILTPLAACDPVPEQSAELANPAATFCVESGGTYEIRDGADGQTGICKLADGQEVDAWDYFRENHSG
ncbi:MULTISPECIES: DUF333 domain-containing protein [unclassified Ruegeria]|uniref:putative hemolysin n=1 Tax=unclassified Ruegeria TaxID=2625375 RepID=UPI0014885104|nr:MULTISPECIES: DUF333 domain-containing protein [unclassified Ruegeria]